MHKIGSGTQSRIIKDDDVRVVPFGQKHKGKTLGQIIAEDRGYIEWLANKPGDLQAAAKAMLAKLSEQNRFALAFRTHNMKTEAGRKKKIETFVAMLKRGETIYPQRRKQASEA